jgi:SagB-type dehydrogenase family enzyme
MNLDRVLDYHERTKHHFRRSARSLGYLDWATQPDAFRRFEGARLVPLDRAPEGASPTLDDLLRPDPVPPAPLDAAGISDLLFHALAVSAWKQAGASRWALRVNPSSGNLHPTEGYLVLPPRERIGDTPAVWHYRPDVHALEERARLASETWASLVAGLPEGSFLVGLTSIVWREAWKYGERAFRYCQHDVGHALAALRLAAALRGWRLRALRTWPADVPARLLGLDREDDFPVPEEREEPEVLAVVSPAPLAGDPPPPPPATLEAAAAARWTGRAKRLSGDHVAWPVLEDVAEASRSEGETVDPESASRFPPLALSVPADARRVIRTRRSGVDFDPRGRTSREAFLRILDRTLPRDAAPWDALPGRARIDLVLFVHRVDDVVPGLYVLVRDPDREPALRAALRDDFEWARPDGLPDHLPLHRLARGDAREIAARLSCGQDIAGDAFFSLGMLAELEGTLRDGEASRYRRLFWEAGLVGQVLYLAAEAEGARGTGIGCYFDDPVHEALGLAGRAHQSLYHFTIGVAADDERLTTLPAYPEEEAP